MASFWQNPIKAALIRAGELGQDLMLGLNSLEAWLQNPSVASLTSDGAVTAGSLTVGGLAPVGVASPAFAAYQVQWGEVVVTTDGVGNFTVTYPTAFTTATLAVVAVQGATGNGGSTMVQCNQSSSRTTFSGRIVNAATATGVTTGTLAVNYIAIGH